MGIKASVSIVVCISFYILAENKVLIDATFPYRIVCEAGWIETAKTDDTLTLEQSSPGKKMRFQLIKDQVDTSFYKENMKWSLMNFMVNKELASETGRLIFFDTSIAIKLGEKRAYEMFAFFCDTTGEDIWWADYCRWTDLNGYGYLVSIIGDTIDMKQNFETNQAFFDSISLTNVSTIHTIREQSRTISLQIRKVSTSQHSAPYDILGRKIPAFTKYYNRFILGKKSKQCIVQ